MKFTFKSLFALTLLIATTAYITDFCVETEQEETGAQQSKSFSEKAKEAFCTTITNKYVIGLGCAAAVFGVDYAQSYFRKTDATITKQVAYAVVNKLMSFVPNVEVHYGEKRKQLLALLQKSGEDNLKLLQQSKIDIKTIEGLNAKVSELTKTPVVVDPVITETPVIPSVPAPVVTPEISGETTGNTNMWGSIKAFFGKK